MLIKSGQKFTRRSNGEEVIVESLEAGINDDSKEFSVVVNYRGTEPLYNTGHADTPVYLEAARDIVDFESEFKQA